MSDLYQDDAGNVYEAIVAEDGGQVLIDQAGTIIHAVNADGDPVDPAGYIFDDQQPVTRDDLAALLAEQQTLIDQQAQQDTPSERSDDVDWNELAHQQQDLEQALGRQLTSAEMTAAARNVSRQFDQGFPIDLDSALASAAETGHVDHVDLSTHDGKVDYVMDRLQQQRDQAAGLNPGDTPQRTAEHYDMATTEGKDNYYADRLSGALSAEDASQHTYDSRDDATVE